MNLTRNELRHSMVLAWLLDHDLRRLGTHAQGSLGFRLFLAELDLPVSLADDWYSVRREVRGEQARVDLELSAPGKFLLHVENKIQAGEGKDQTDREWTDLQRRATSLGIDPCRAGAHVYGLFLTVHGTRPRNAQFRVVSWRQVAAVLERFSTTAKPAEVRLFSSHYARVLRRFVIREELATADGGDNGTQVANAIGR